jgi:N-acetylmuramoyl-L-alanine amidase
VVEQGECLSSIAKAFGFADWRVIYDDPDNAEFKKKRPSPDLIYPGDELIIPDRVPFTTTLATGKAYAFKVKAPRPCLRLALEIEEPYAYELTIGDVATTGQTDGKQAIEVSIRADLEAATLTIWPASADPSTGVTWNLALGHLDPVEELSGVQGRLSNLGYFWGAVDGEPSPDLDDALRRFQADEKIDQSNGLDNATRAKLSNRHDGV